MDRGDAHVPGPLLAHPAGRYAVADRSIGEMGRWHRERYRPRGERRAQAGAEAASARLPALCLLRAEHPMVRGRRRDRDPATAFPCLRAPVMRALRPGVGQTVGRGDGYPARRHHRGHRRRGEGPMAPKWLLLRPRMVRAIRLLEGYGRPADARDAGPVRQQPRARRHGRYRDAPDGAPAEAPARQMALRMDVQRSRTERSPDEDHGAVLDEGDAPRRQPLVNNWPFLIPSLILSGRAGRYPF